VPAACRLNCGAVRCVALWNPHPVMETMHYCSVSMLKTMTSFDNVIITISNDNKHDIVASVHKQSLGGVIIFAAISGPLIHDVRPVWSTIL